jgi:hypothetical protein
MEDVMMCNIEIVKSARIIQVKSNFHPDLPLKARELGGIWTGDTWAFDITLEAEVIDLYTHIFGEAELKSNQ